jgi:hypothetical protein
MARMHLKSAEQSFFSAIFPQGVLEVGDKFAAKIPVHRVYLKRDK